MSFVNLANYCPATMTIRTQAGIIMVEHTCALEKDHQGPHRSEGGLVWANQVPMLNNVKRIA